MHLVLPRTGSGKEQKVLENSQVSSQNRVGRAHQRIAAAVLPLPLCRWSSLRQFNELLRPASPSFFAKFIARVHSAKIADLECTHISSCHCCAVVVPSVASSLNLCASHSTTVVALTHSPLVTFPRGKGRWPKKTRQTEKTRKQRNEKNPQSRPPNQVQRSSYVRIFPVHKNSQS